MKKNLFNFKHSTVCLEISTKEFATILNNTIECLTSKCIYYEKNMISFTDTKIKYDNKDDLKEFSQKIGYMYHKYFDEFEFTINLLKTAFSLDKYSFIHYEKSDDTVCIFIDIEDYLKSHFIKNTINCNERIESDKFNINLFDINISPKYLITFWDNEEEFLKTLSYNLKKNKNFKDFNAKSLQILYEYDFGEFSKIYFEYSSLSKSQQEIIENEKIPIVDNIITLDSFFKYCFNINANVMGCCDIQNECSVRVYLDFKEFINEFKSEKLDYEPTYIKKIFQNI